MARYGREYGDANLGARGVRPGGMGGRGRDYDRGYGGPRAERGMGYRAGRGGAMRASDIMTENPETVTPDASVADAARRMRELDVGIIPVVESEGGRRLRGVVTDRDLAIRVLAEGKDAQAKVRDCMSADVETVNKNDSVREVLRVMEREQVRRVPVVDRENRLVGIIAQADLAVDYAEGDRGREVRTEEAIERISEPARPNRGRGWR